MTGEFVTWEQIQPIIYVMIGVGAFLIFLKWRYTYIQAIMKEQKSIARQKKSLKGIIDQKIADIPDQLSKVNNELAHLEKTGANEKQMKSLKDKKRLLELGRDYGDVFAEIATPIIENVLGTFKTFSKGF